MEFFNLSKVLDISRTLVEKYYPNADCCILTGSQVEEDFVTVISDIDILIIDSNISSISSEGIEEFGYKIDFTRVGTKNLWDAIIESCYTNNNTVINMIIQGIFINDRLNIEEDLKKYCNHFYSKSNLDYFNEYQVIRRNLLRLRKHFSKELKANQIPLTLSDFMLEISKAYLFFNYNGKYGMDGFRRSKLLSKTKDDLFFLDSINRVVENYFITKENKYLIHKLDSFLSFSLLNVGHPNNIRYILNIDYGHDDNLFFINEIIRTLRCSSKVSKYFKYAQRVTRNSIFKYSYILVFDTKNIDDSTLLQLLYNTSINNTFLLDFKTEPVDSFIIDQLYPNHDVYNAIENVLTTINNITLNLFESENKFSYKRIIPLFLFLIEIQKDNSNINDIPRVLNFIKEKFKLASYYDTTAAEEIEEVNAIQKELEQTYLRENVKILSEYKTAIVNKSIFELETIFQSFKDLRNELKLLNNISFEITDIPLFWRKIIGQDVSKDMYLLILLIESTLRTSTCKESQFPAILSLLSNIYNDDF